MYASGKQALKAADDAEDEASNGGGGGNNHDEAAEILSDLVQNQMSIRSINDNSQLIEAQTTALQQLLQQGGASAAAKQQAIHSIFDAAAAKGDGEKKHLFWDTQVSNKHIVQNWWRLYCNQNLQYLRHIPTSQLCPLMYIFLLRFLPLIFTTHDKAHAQFERHKQQQQHIKQ